MRESLRFTALSYTSLKGKAFTRPLHRQEYQFVHSAGNAGKYLTKGYRFSLARGLSNSAESRRNFSCASWGKSPKVLASSRVKPWPHLIQR